MQFYLVAYDGTDADAPARRQAVREAHLENARKMKAKGEMLIAVAILNDEGGMVGSSVVLEFPDRAALDKWLETEPYVTGDVWRHIEVKPCKVPDFLMP